MKSPSMFWSGSHVVPNARFDGLRIALFRIQAESYRCDSGDTEVIHTITADQPMQLHHGCSITEGIDF